MSDKCAARIWPAGGYRPSPCLRPAKGEREMEARTPGGVVSKVLPACGIHLRVKWAPTRYQP